MRILVLSSAKRDPKPFLDKMKGWGIEAEVRPLSLKLEFKRKRGRDEIYPHSLQAVADHVYATDGEAIDAIYLFLSSKDWDYGGSLKGIAYHATYNGYQIGAFKDRNGWDKTARHELGHHLDNICRIYTGVRLEDVVGVKDWDDDVIHRKKKGRGYDYDFDKEYFAAKPYIEAAITQRRFLYRASILAKLSTRARAFLVSTKSPEVITEDTPEPNPPTMTNREILYNTAYGCLGIDMAPTQDSLGCAEALSFVMKKAGVKGLPKNGIASSAVLDQWLSKNLTRVDAPLPGDIIMNPTGSGNGSVRGHTGVVGKNSIMSNNSATFKWDYHWTLPKWLAYYEKKGGIKTRYYRWA